MNKIESSDIEMNTISKNVYMRSTNVDIFKKDSVLEFESTIKTEDDEYNTDRHIQLAIRHRSINILKYIFTYCSTTINVKQLDRYIPIWLEHEDDRIGLFLFGMCTMHDIAYFYHGYRDDQAKFLEKLGDLGRFDMCEYITNTTREENTVKSVKPVSADNNNNNNSSSLLKYKMMKSFTVDEQPSPLHLAIKYNSYQAFLQYPKHSHEYAAMNRDEYTPQDIDIKHTIVAGRCLLLEFFLTNWTFPKFHLIQFAIAQQASNDIICLLVRYCKEEDYEDRDVWGNRLLHLVTPTGDHKLIQSVISKGKEIYKNKFVVHLNYTSETPLSFMQHDSLAILDLLIEPLNLYIANNDGVLPIHRFAQRNLINVVKHLHRINNTWIERRTNNSLRPIHFACNYGAIETVEFLNNLETLELVERDVSTPLYLILHQIKDRSDCVVTIEKMLKHYITSSSLYFHDCLTGKTALQFAVEHNLYDVVRCLVKYMPSNIAEYLSFRTIPDAKMNKLLKSCNFIKN